jgi:peroxiredoxin Q/BCP
LERIFADPKEAVMTNLSEGQKAPDFSLEEDGRDAPLGLSDLRGQLVVLYFYPKDDTSGCTAEAKEFSCMMGDFASAGATVVGVSPDSLKSHAKFRDKHGLKVRLAADEDKALANAYGVWVEKSMYGRKYMGVERATFLIDAKGKIARIWRNVKVNGHAQDVLDAVLALKSA